MLFERLKIAKAGIVLVSAFVCMCVEILRRLILKNGDIWFWRLYLYSHFVHLDVCTIGSKAAILAAGTELVLINDVVVLQLFPGSPAAPSIICSKVPYNPLNEDADGVAVDA